ncbi:5-oxoprolinase subunit PxpA [Maribacter sp. 2307ULW6-5]|uniref:5-oxoprolinase subunit PxpA n=1 Tax=Maribacter sp. 2307ULW6-5 TaxID=3386275 RepID=UPI0039BD14AF
MAVEVIDINCDVGEGVGNEAQLFPFISSCSIACGGHAGDAQTIAQMLRLALEHKVKVGAHPSYPDRANFGRKTLKMTPRALKDSLAEQMGLITGLCDQLGVPLHHIKPHGALYNDIARDEALANLFFKAVAPFAPNAVLYLLSGSKVVYWAKHRGFAVREEAFADRNYNEDKGLMPRSEANALITAPDRVLSHLLSIVKEGKVMVPGKTKVSLRADTFCVHGDTPTALQILMYLHRELPKHQINLLP